VHEQVKQFAVESAAAAAVAVAAQGKAYSAAQQQRQHNMTDALAGELNAERERQLQVLELNSKKASEKTHVIYYLGAYLVYHTRPFQLKVINAAVHHIAALQSVGSAHAER
jgi:hypothetical protein